MKKGILVSYIDDIKYNMAGESYSTILRYFFPELVTAFILYSALALIDARFIGSLKSTSLYGTLGVTNGIFHFIFKAAEGISIGASILCGQFNGHAYYKRVGHTLAQAFWISMLTGLAIAFVFYGGAYWIYYFNNVPERMITLGTPYLQLRALSIFFIFIYFAFIGFFRGIKNTRIPMNIFVVGAAVFLFFDYALIFGKFGFPAMGMRGSAMATLLQSIAMAMAALIAVFWDKDYRKYAINLFQPIDKESLKQLFLLSWPVVLDKSIMAVTYIWLAAMIAPMGKYIIASFTVIKDMERLSFLPAIAFAQIITFLASNDFGAAHYENIKINIKKVLLLSTIFVAIIVVIFCLFPGGFIRFFDQKGAFTEFSIQVFPLVSALVFLDVLQLVLSGALRGIGHVRLVMWSRFFICFGFFFPVSYILSHMHFSNEILKFVLIYGSFYIANGLMSLVYINKFRSDTWKLPTITRNNG